MIFFFYFIFEFPGETGQDKNRRVPLNRRQDRCTAAVNRVVPIDRRGVTTTIVAIRAAERVPMSPEPERRAADAGEDRGTYRVSSG
jgi:hypothetical protein